MKWIIIACTVSVAFFCFISISYESARNKERAVQAEEQIKIYSNQIKHAEKVTESLAIQVNELETESKKLEEELTNALKDNKCFNERVPASVTDKLRQRANSLR